MRFEPELLEYAARQHALVGRFQAAELGLDRRGWYRLSRSGRWELLSRSVLRLAGSPRNDRAARDGGRARRQSGRCALRESRRLAWWDLAGFRLDPDAIHVLRPRGVSSTTRSTSATIHHAIKSLAPDHVRVLDGIPVTSPARTIFDLARTEHPGRVERALDNAWSKRLLCGRDLEAALDDLAASGRDGITMMRELLAGRGPGYVPPASGLEHRFERILADHCLPAMRRQVDSGGERWVGRVDYRAHDVPLLVEINSERYHAALSDRRADEVRYEALRAAGFEVVSAWDYEVWSQPAMVAERVRAARRKLLAAAARALTPALPVLVTGRPRFRRHPVTKTEGGRERSISQ